MRFFTIATTLALLGLEATATKTTSIDSGTFDYLKCAAGVGWTYGQNNCAKTSITDKCNKVWNHIEAFNISDGNNGIITVRLFQKPDSQEVYLFFPGSNSFSNFQTDADSVLVGYDFNGVCPGCQVHRGFIGAFLGFFGSTRDQIVNKTKSAMNKNPGYNLVIAGGSLGGALAALAYGEFYSNWNYGLFPVRGISFGMPRVGNGQWAGYMNGLINDGDGNPPKWLRAIHGSDSIPRLPNGPPQWMHFGWETWMVDTATSSGVTPTAGTTNNCTYGAFGSEPQDCSNTIPGTGNLFDHTTYPGYQGQAPSC